MCIRDSSTGAASRLIFPLGAENTSAQDPRHAAASPATDTAANAAVSEAFPVIGSTPSTP